MGVFTNIYLNLQAQTARPRTTVYLQIGISSVWESNLRQQPITQPVRQHISETHSQRYSYSLKKQSVFKQNYLNYIVSSQQKPKIPPYHLPSQVWGVK